MSLSRTSAKQLNKEIEALREIVQAEATPLPGGAGESRSRVGRAAHDFEFFAKTYFPHYLSKPSSKFHKYQYDRLQTLVLQAHGTGTGDRQADAAPRGNAKSTNCTLILPLWCAAFKYRLFHLLVSETAAQGEDFLSFIKVELESNERLKQDYPDLCGEGPVWRAMNIITANGVRIKAAGAGQKLRGLRHGARRPDLVIGDDLENDENVVSPDQRAKLEKWFFRALTKVGKKYTVYIVIGTILHYDSLLSALLKKPGWKGKKFQSVISWSKSRLWDAWEAIFSDITVGKEEAESRADAFFEANRQEMLAGTEVLWPEEEDYYYLMKMRVSEGAAHFDSEKQNEPINPDECLFKAEEFVYWEDGDVDLDGYPVYAAVDPSLGKRSKKHDPSAIITGRYRHGIIWLEIADIEKRHPDRIIEDVLLYHEKQPIQKAGVEVVQFQQFFKDTLEKIAHERNLTLNIEEVQQTQDKVLRIQSLQPWIKNGWIRFKKNMATLVDQLSKFPMADHDDGPDALEILKTLIENNPGVQTVDVLPVFGEAAA